MNKIFKIYISFCVCISTLSVLCTTSMAKDIAVENEYLVLKNNLEQAQSKFYLQKNRATMILSDNERRVAYWKNWLKRCLKLVDDLKGTIGIKRSIRDYGIDEKAFLDTLDEMTLQAFDDQCTGANPRYPMMEEIRQIYLNAYYGGAR